MALGEAIDVLNTAAEDQQIEITVGMAGHFYTFRLEVSADRALYLPISEKPAELPPSLTSKGMHFTYLTAERLGPRDQLSVSSADIESVGIGEQGQYIAQVLTLRERDEVSENLRHPSAPQAQTLRAQTEAWLSDIVRPIQITPLWPVGLSACLVRFQIPGLVSNPVRPGNVGFGVSYALPVIVAGLAVGNGLLIVENPEAHLHPAGQSKLGRFLGRVAGSGAQVIIETHSDHVVNGIRLAVADDGTLMPSDVTIQYFDTVGPLTMNLDAQGGLSAWPPGFFDQLEEDLGRLARAKRRTR